MECFLVSYLHPKRARAQGQAIRQGTAQFHPLLTCIFRRARLHSVLLSVLCCLAGNQAHAEARIAYSPDSHEWLQSVGRLKVPGSRLENGRRRHHVEDCSATLIKSPEANLVVTAWHCLEFYDDLSRPIYFYLTGAGRPQTRHEATILSSGGGMHADWAVLRLRRAVQADVAVGLPLQDQRADPQRNVIMAGFSRDTGLGESGERLTYDPACKITLQNRRNSETNCVAFKGASGGAVVQHSQNGVPLFSGVISQGNGEGTSTFIPINQFRREVSAALYN